MATSDNSLAEDRLEGRAGTHPIDVAVIGLASSGKTTVIRALSRNAGFGKVSPKTGTTTLKESLDIGDPETEDPVFRLIDTPGFQMSGKILDLLEERFPDRSKSKWTIEDLLSLIPDDADYSFDRLAWSAVKTSGLLLYVVNAWESPEQSLHRDTLSLLAAVRKPLIFLFNYHDAEKDAPIAPYVEKWLKELQRREFYAGYYENQVFDAFRGDFENERELLTKIARWFDSPLKEKIRALIDYRKTKEICRRVQISRDMILHLMIDLAMARETREKITPELLRSCRKKLKKEMEESLQRRISARKLSAFKEICSLWNHPSPGLDSRGTEAISAGAEGTAGTTGSVGANRTDPQTPSLSDSLLGGSIHKIRTFFSSDEISGENYFEDYNKKTEEFSLFPTPRLLIPRLEQVVTLVKALEENRPIERVLTEIPTPSKTVAPRFFKELGRMADPGRLSRFFGGYLSKSETDEERTGPTEEERNRIEAALTEDLINLLPDPEGD